MLLLTIALFASALLVWLSGVFLLEVLGLHGQNPFLAFWVGMLPVGLTGLLLSLIAPLQGTVALACFWASGLGAWQIWRKRLWLTNLSVVGCVLVAALIALLAYKTGYAEFRAGGGGDTTDYHLHLVRYLREYGTVTGRPRRCGW